MIKKKKKQAQEERKSDTHPPTPPPPNPNTHTHTHTGEAAKNLLTGTTHLLPGNTHEIGNLHCMPYPPPTNGVLLLK